MYTLLVNPNGVFFMKCRYHLCNNELTGRQRVFCSKNCNVKHRVKKWRIELKKKAVAYKGGACIKCGYNKCIWAMDFHHKDRTTKSFGISKDGLTRGWEKVKIELDKCDLVCSNCHREIESEYK